MTWHFPREIWGFVINAGDPTWFRGCCYKKLILQSGKSMDTRKAKKYGEDRAKCIKMWEPSEVSLEKWSLIWSLGCPMRHTMCVR